MSDDKVRAEFEEVAKSDKWLNLCRLPHGGYRSFETQQAWWFWQASRASLCVELPTAPATCDMASTLICDTIKDCAAALDKAGVKYK